jgi:hypothetical protein
MKELSLEDMQRMKRTLDDAAVPLSGRILSFIGKDGNVYTIGLNNPSNWEGYDQLPDSLLEGLSDCL